MRGLSGRIVVALTHAELVEIGRALRLISAADVDAGVNVDAASLRAKGSAREAIDRAIDYHFAGRAASTRPRSRRK